MGHLVTAAERPCPATDRQGRERPSLHTQAAKARGGELPAAVQRLIAAEHASAVPVAAFQSAL
ncbi:hypothetical protein [Streptomyces melanogenes]|uniref:hypothetical protein n=1 Tax=Streptomyces melanogenes TaxID=67326 RepID=UPI00167CAD2A|nr:hypothetical protein [Streptomyces melanogenes]GGP92833.1 hypothetical protein GCM10010278_83560 [Streptomyces melanogenes]